MGRNIISNVDEASEAITYTGYAIIGTADDEAGWVITKTEIAGNITTTRKTGVELTKVWDDRASLSYS